MSLPQHGVDPGGPAEVTREATGRRLLIAVIALFLGIAFVATALVSFLVSKHELRESIISEELPLTSDTIYSEIQRELVQPIFISSTMANDTFLRDWVLAGEHDVGQMTKYLNEIKTKYGAFTAFFVSERTRKYYYADGILKTVSESEPRDVWYFRVRQMAEDYELNVDLDMAHRDALTIFINYRVYDYDHRFIGAAGVGLTVNAVRQLIERLQQRYGRLIYFVNGQGRIMLSGVGEDEGDIRKTAGLAAVADAALNGTGGSFEYVRGGQTHLLNVRFIPELHWYVFVEKVEDEALAGIRRALYANLAVALFVTTIVVVVLALTIRRFQSRLESMATTDKLTGLTNRQAYDILMRQAAKEARRAGEPLCLIMADIDHFKEINDRFGHLRGDGVLKSVAGTALQGLRDSDIACRWGGEEFLILLRKCNLENAQILAERIRGQVEKTPVEVDGEAPKVTVSLGVAELADAEDEDKLLSRTDHALYRAKREGRNRVVLG
ncbi:MAG: diguanylate cyclase [Alphaproteobacteria bacterium]